MHLDGSLADAEVEADLFVQLPADQVNVAGPGVRCQHTRTTLFRDMIHARLQSDLNAYRGDGFDPPLITSVDGLVAMTWGHTFMLRQDDRSFQGIYVGAGPCLAAQAYADFDGVSRDQCHVEQPVFDALDEQEGRDHEPQPGAEHQPDQHRVGLAPDESQPEAESIQRAAEQGELPACLYARPQSPRRASPRPTTVSGSARRPSPPLHPG
jgi:hypothetical protein